jgi:hypothetical protein
MPADIIPAALAHTLPAYVRIERAYARREIRTDQFGQQRETTFVSHDPEGLQFICWFTGRVEDGDLRQECSVAYRLIHVGQAAERKAA